MSSTEFVGSLWSITACHFFFSSSFRRRPPFWPRARAASSPARVRADEVPLELGQGGKHVEDKLVAAGRRVDALLEAAEPALPPAAARCRLPLNNLYILSNELLSSWWIEPGRF